MTRRILEVAELGVVEYDDGLEIQDDLRQAVTAGELPDQLLLLEHPPVITLGRNVGRDHVRLSPEELAERGIAFYETGRGGDVTFHGPGQIVGYPIVDLNPDRRDVHRYVRDLEEALIRTLEDFEVSSGRIPGLTGVWIGDLKIAAIGVRISRWVTSHGFAFNIGTDLSFFETIVPCGIEDRGVTSLSRVLQREVAIDEVRPKIAARFAEVFEREAHVIEPPQEIAQVLVWRRTSEGPQILVLKRVPDDGGFWQPVTGRLEPGETPAQAGAREVEEESGIRGEVVSLDFVRDFRIERKYVGGGSARPRIFREHAFALEASDARVTLSPREHEAHLWTTPAKARELFKWTGNRRALDRLERMIAA